MTDGPLSPAIVRAMDLLARRGAVRARLERGDLWLRRHRTDRRFAAEERRWLDLLDRYTTLCDQLAEESRP
jgi:hypothetical protein